MHCVHASSERSLQVPEGAAVHLWQTIATRFLWKRHNSVNSYYRLKLARKSWKQSVGCPIDPPEFHLGRPNGPASEQIAVSAMQNESRQT